MHRAGLVSGGRTVAQPIRNPTDNRFQLRTTHWMGTPLGQARMDGK
jgi:hypothetical protein